MDVINIEDNKFPSWLRDDRAPTTTGIAINEKDQDVQSAKGVLLEGIYAEACRLTELAVVLDFPLKELVGIVTGNYETSLLDLEARHSQAMGWMHVGEEEREAIMIILKKAPPRLPSGECYVCGERHSG
jgi:hypothetical protein